jgi:hypothetical protein
MKRSIALGLLCLLALAPGCTTPGVNRVPELEGSEATLSEDHDVLAYLAIGGVT